MARKLLLLLVLLLQNVLVVLCGKQCPSGCICISQQNAVPASYCDGLGLRRVPKNIVADTEILSLTLNTFHKITDKDFADLTQLTRLSLKMNGIQEISDDAFLKLSKLKSLNLGKNYLRTISIKVFQNLPALEELHLNDNQLESLPKDLFKFLPNLKKLYLQNNRFRKEESISISNLQNLEYLDLSKNKLTAIRSRMFENAPKLKSVKLYENQIETVESDSFDSLPQLSEVLLNNNDIYTLDKGVFANKSKLAKVTLHGNPLRCDCDIYWIYHKLTSEPHVFREKEKMKCHSPSRLVGKPLVELFKENFGCRISVWGSWVKWSTCDKPCDGGQRSRFRNCISSSSDGTNDCKGPKKEIEPCNVSPCTTGGLTSAWSTWTDCPANWRQAQRKRERKCINPFTGSEEGASCTEQLVEKQSCHGKPINGGWSGWSPWSACDKECLVGIATRTRTCTNPIPQFNGALCNGLNTQKETKVCFAALCPPKTYWSEWGEYTECTSSCGEGFKTRRRYCMNEFNKRINIRGICPGQDTQSIECHNKQCQTNGLWSSWLQWSSCDQLSCKRSRVRTCVNIDEMKSQEQSHCKGQSIEQKFCGRSICSIHSVWSQWQTWSQCSKLCSGGIRTRIRECPGERNHPSVTCGEKRLDSESCNTHACTNHRWSNWGEWTKCPNAFSNKQVRKRECLGDGPKQCKGRSKERRECRKRKEVVDEGEVVKGKNKKCQPRGNIQNGKERITLTKDGLRAEYTCNRHYRLKGGPVRMTCTNGKGWTSSFVPYCVPNCGKTVYKSYSYWHSRARLHGGEITVPHSWPWQVVIEVKTRREGWKLRCGGSLVNDRWVVTAGHCLFDKPPEWRLFRPKEIKVYMGVHNLTEREKNKNIQMSYAKFVIANPNFHHTLLDNDIGLIELKTPVKLNNKVLPVCLPSRKQKHLADVGNVGTVIGWGVTRNKRASEVLKELRLPVISYENCVNAYKLNYNVTASMFCAGKNTAEDTCKGDSGGGFLFRDPRKKKWTLQGVVSWGGTSCGKPDQPSVYTKVSTFTSWIRKVIRERRFPEERKRGHS